MLVGDLMRSLSLLLYKPEEGTLELRAQVSGQPQGLEGSKMEGGGR